MRPDSGRAPARSDETSDGPAPSRTEVAASLEARLTKDDDPPELVEFVRHLALERGLATNTCLAYRADLQQLFAFLTRKRLPPLKATAQDLTDFLWERAQGGLKPRSLFRKMEAVRAFYRFQLAEERLVEDPTRPLKSPRLPERMPRYLSRREMQALLDVVPGPGFEGLRAKTMLEVLYAAGLRASELLALRPEGLQMEDGWLRVMGKGSKERMVPLQGRVLETLRRYLYAREWAFRKKKTDPEIFINRYGRKLSRVQFWKDLKALGRRAGIDQRLFPHLLRHTFATHLIQGGADLRAVQEMLGHAQVTTTQIYTHLDKSALKQIHKRHHPRG